MKYTLCVPVAEELPGIAADRLRRALSVADFAELRLDYMKPGLVVSFLEEVSGDLSRCICTIRSKQEGGRFAGTEEERRRLLFEVSEFEPYLQDVELATIQDCPSLRNTSNMMISWHDFAGSPGDAELRHRLDTMTQYSDVVKMVVTAHKGSDAAAILGLYAAHTPSSLIAFAMGEVAKFSRICSMHLGAPFMYVSMYEATAPGQYTLNEIRHLEKSEVI